MYESQEHYRLDMRIIEQGLRHWDYDVRKVSMNACAGRNDVQIMEWIQQSWVFYAAAMNACIGRDDFPMEWIERGFNSQDPDARKAAMKACAGRTDIPLETIDQWRKNDDWLVRSASMLACIGRTDVPLEWIVQGITDEDCGVRVSAIDVCADRKDIQPSVMAQWLNDHDWAFRAAVMSACIGRTDVPLEWIEQMAQDDNYIVRILAMQAYNQRGVPIPTSRNFEPPDIVFKKCVNDVIVAAEIPKDAHIRSKDGKKFRASKAVIKDIFGDYFGEKVGISVFDKKTFYRVGEEIIIENFDLGNEEFSNGLHFFCTREAAENY